MRIAMLAGTIVLLTAGLTWAQAPTTAPAMTDAVAVVRPLGDSKVSGVVRFHQDGQKVRVTAEILGLAPNSKHGFHIHEYGDCSCDDGTCAGGHYNPEGHPHGLPPAAARHAGDFGNLEADAKGLAKFDLTLDNISIAGPKAPILGRAVIIHAKPDDGSQPTGNAGGRIGCGVIGLAKPTAK